MSCMSPQYIHVRYPYWINKFYTTSKLIFFSKQTDTHEDWYLGTVNSIRIKVWSIPWKQLNNCRWWPIPWNQLNNGKWWAPKLAEFCIAGFIDYRLLFSSISTEKYSVIGVEKVGEQRVKEMSMLKWTQFMTFSDELCGL